jgi:hypothetical protein
MLPLPTSKSANKDQLTLEMTLESSKVQSASNPMTTVTASTSVKTLESIPSFGQLQKSSSKIIAPNTNNSHANEI